MAVKKNEESFEEKFSKEQILLSKKYRKNKDILRTILKDEETYSFKEVDSLIEKFMKGKVK